MSTQSTTASSVELAVRLAEDAEFSAPGRGADLQLVLTHEWLESNKKRGLTSAEKRIKEALWQWFSALTPGALERVRALSTMYRAGSRRPRAFAPAPGPMRMLFSMRRHGRPSTRSLPQPPHSATNLRLSAAPRTPPAHVQIFTIVDKQWVDVLIKLDKSARKRHKGGVFVPALEDRPPSGKKGQRRRSLQE
jgi:hypothetical protein